MPRITPFRVVFSLVAGYICLLGFWLALPSPSYINSNNADFYHAYVLRSGSVLTTVHETSLIHQFEIRDDYQPSRSGYAIDWRLETDCKRGSIILHIGTDSLINLTEFASWDSEPPQPKQLEITVKTGDDDGANPPWFSYADAILLFWDIHRESERLKVAVKSPMPGCVEIGPYPHKLAIIEDIPLSEDRCNPNRLQITEMSDMVPTKTYKIRHYIILVLAPLTLMIVAIAGPLSTICFAIAYLVMVVLVVYCITMWICWATCGFRLWPQGLGTSVFNRGFRRTKKHSIWGVTGPLPELEYDNYDHVRNGLDGPVPLTSVWSFFKSKSPLDDLLVTFEATRWMLHPLTQQSRERHMSEFDIEEVIPAPSKAEIIIDNSRV